VIVAKPSNVADYLLDYSFLGANWHLEKNELIIEFHRMLWCSYC